MSSQSDKSDVQALMKERMSQLPKIVLQAITSADIEKQLRALADGHKLHIDQWAKLEDEVMIALMGLSNINDLSSNIQKEVGVSSEVAAELATDISKIVFEPIRQELERELSHPQAKAAEVSPEEAARRAVLAAESSAQATPTVSNTPTAPPTTPQAVLPATPPAPAPTEKAVRAPISASYTARQASTERKGVEGDPYREPPV